MGHAQPLGFAQPQAEQAREEAQRQATRESISKSGERRKARKHKYAQADATLARAHVCARTH
jgi:hypothetical protein